MLKVQGNELIHAYMVDNQAIVVPETIDAICAHQGRERGQRIHREDRCRPGHRRSALVNAKIAVGGAGRVGSTLAYTLASLCVAHEIVVIDAHR